MRKSLVALALAFAFPVAAQVPGPNEARLNWEYPFPGVELFAFVIERKDVACGVAGTWVEIENNLDGTVLTYLDTGLADGDYCWRVRARSATDTSGPSNEAGKTIGAVPPPSGAAVPPTNLTVQ